MSHRGLKFAWLVVLLCAATGCGRRMPPLMVGSYASTERMLVAEIAAQALEKRLGKPVVRKFDIGSLQIAYEGLMLGNIDVYPEDTVGVVVSVLKESVDPNPDIVFERVRGEMARIARIQVLNPLGIHSRTVMVMRASDRRDGGIETLSQAAQSKLAWTIGDTSEFASRPDGYTALMSEYNLPLKVATRMYAPGLLYPALAQNQVSLISGHDTDGPLAGPDFAILKDDKGAFQESRTCLMVRQGALDLDPQIRPALAQLSGKFTNESFQKLCYRVDVLKRPVKDVAAEFLQAAGL